VITLCDYSTLLLDAAARGVEASSLGEPQPWPKTLPKSRHIGKFYLLPDRADAFKREARKIPRLSAVQLAY